jgi:hypothetical protein
MRLKKTELQTHFMTIFSFFKEAFDFSRVYFSENEVDVDRVDDLEDSLIKAFVEYSVKLTES